MKNLLLAACLMLALLMNPAFAGKNEDLRWAVSYNYLDKVEAYLDQGYDINGRTSGGYTPLMIAAEQDYEEMVEFLLARGANPSLKSDTGKKALDYAYSQTVKDMLSKAEGITPAKPKPAPAKTAAPAAKNSGTTASKPLDHCTKMYGMSYKLCGSSDYSCKIKATNGYQKCQKTGTWY